MCCPDRCPDAGFGTPPVGCGVAVVRRDLVGGERSVPEGPCRRHGAFPERARVAWRSRDGLTPAGAGRPWRACFRIALAFERCDVVAVWVQVLAAGQAPGPAGRLAAGVADPESGRVVLAVDAQLDGVRPREGRGYGGRWGSRWRGGPVLPGRHRCGRRQVLGWTAALGRAGLGGSSFHGFFCCSLGALGGAPLRSRCRHGGSGRRWRGPTRC